MGIRVTLIERYVDVGDFWRAMSRRAQLGQRPLVVLLRRERNLCKSVELLAAVLVRVAHLERRVPIGQIDAAAHSSPSVQRIVNGPSDVWEGRRGLVMLLEVLVLIVRSVVAVTQLNVAVSR